MEPDSSNLVAASQGHTNKSNHGAYITLETVIMTGAPPGGLDGAADSNAVGCVPPIYT